MPPQLIGPTINNTTSILTMQHQGVNRPFDIKGIVRNTSASTCQDGELEELINLRYKDGHYVPINNHQPLQYKGQDGVVLSVSPTIDYEYIFLHNNNFQHFLGVKDGVLYYFADMDDEGYVTMQQNPVRLMNVNSASKIGVQYTQTGNIVTVLDTGQLKYIYWRKDHYNILQPDYNGGDTDESLNPEGKISFRLEPKYFSDGGRMLRAIRSTEPVTNEKFNEPDKNWETRRATAQALALQSRLVSRQKGEPTGFFYVCTAIRLFDGNYILQSRPVLIAPPNSRYVRDEYKDLHEFNAVRWYKSTLKNNDSEIEDKDTFSAVKTEGEGLTYWEMSDKPDTPYNQIVFHGDSIDNMQVVFQNLNKRILMPDSTQFPQVQAKCGFNTGSVDFRHLHTITQNYKDAVCVPDLTAIHGASGLGVDTTGTDVGLGAYVDAHKIFKDEVDRVKEYIKDGSTYSTAMGTGWDSYYGHIPMVGVVITRFILLHAKRNDLISDVLNKGGKNAVKIGNSYYYAIVNNMSTNQLIYPHNRQYILSQYRGGSYMYLFNEPNVLQYKINANLDPSYEDIIDSVCVFMTTEQELMNVINESEQKRNTGTIRNIIKREALLRSLNGYDHPMYAIAQDPPRPWGENYTFEQDKSSDIIERLHNTQNFYLIKEIKYKDYFQGDWITIDLEKDGVLQNLTAQPTLNLDATDRNSYQPQATLMFNGKLHLANYRQDMFKGFPLNYFFDEQCYGNNHYWQASQKTLVAKAYNTYGNLLDASAQWNAANKYMVLVEVDIETKDGTTTVSRYIRPSSEGFTLKKLNPILSYPDSRAKKMRITLQYTDTNSSVNRRVKYTFPLIPHSTFQFAYYIDPDLKPIDLLSDYHPKDGSRSAGSASNLSNMNFLYSCPDTTTDSEYIPNGLRVSAVNNPMYFPKENTYKVGNMAVTALAVNAVQLSEGQAGDCPLFAFATDGIYGFFVDASGELTYSNSRPISRDVCNNWRSVTYTDAGVAFTTFRGLFLIGDKQTSVDMSDSVEGRFHDFTNSSAEDYLSAAHNAVNHPQITKLLPYVTKEDFIDYIKGAIVGYNAHDRELWVSNPSKAYSYIYSLENSAWSKRSVSCDQYVNNYPETYMLRDKQLTVLGHETTSGNDVLMLSRAIKAQTQEFKNLYRLIVRGLYHLPEAGSALFHIIEARAAELVPPVRDITVKAPDTLELTATANSETLTAVSINRVTPVTFDIASDYKTVVFDPVIEQIFSSSSIDKQFILPQCTFTDTIIKAWKTDGTHGYKDYNGDLGARATRKCLLFQIVRRLTFDERPSNYLDNSNNLIAYPWIDTSYDNNKGMFALPSGKLMTVTDTNSDSVDIAVSTGNNELLIYYYDADTQTYIKINNWSVGQDGNGKWYFENTYLSAGNISETVYNSLNLPTNMPATDNVTASYFEARRKPHGGAYDRLYSTDQGEVYAMVNMRSLDLWYENPMPTSTAYNIHLQKSSNNSGVSLLENSGYNGTVASNAAVTWDGTALTNFTLGQSGVTPTSIDVGDNGRYRIIDTAGGVHEVLITDLNTTITYADLMDKIEGGDYAPLDDSLTYVPSETPCFKVTDRDGEDYYIVVRPIGGETVEDEGEPTEVMIVPYGLLMQYIYEYVHFVPSTDTLHLFDGTMYSVTEYRKNSSNEYEYVPHQIFVTRFRSEQVDILASDLLTSLASHTDVYVDDEDNGLYVPTSKDMITPSELSYPKGTPLHIYDNVNEREYRVYFDESVPIGTLQFLMKNNRKVPLTTMTDDVFTLPGDTNVTFTDLTGESWWIYVRETESLKYEELMAILNDDLTKSDIEDMHFPPALLTLDHINIDMTDGEPFRLTVMRDGTPDVYGDYIYSGDSPITAQQLIYNIQMQQYQQVGSIWGEKTYRVPLGKPVRFVDGINSATYEFIVLPGASTAESILVTYDNLVSGLTGQAHTLIDINGATYQWQPFSSQDVAASYAGLYIFGSYDCRRWMLLGANEKSGTFRDLGALVERLDCKYYKFCFAAHLSHGSLIDMIDMTCKSQIYEGKIR